MSIVFYAPKEVNVGVCFVNYTSQFLQSKPNYYFVFGDNLTRTGNGGQAIIRNEPNSIGIVTKRNPDTTTSSYMTGTDHDFDAVNADFNKLNLILDEGHTIIFPSKGLGTGLSKLQIYSPHMLSYIDSRVSKLIKTNYEMVRKYKR